MNAKDNQDLHKLTELIEAKFTELNANVSKIDRAIYGDPANKVQGLIDYNKETQSEMQKIDARFHKEIKDVKVRLSSIERIKNQVRWVSGAIAAGVGVGGVSLYEWIMRIK
jgi:predicted DNA binding CopG/RHH family protein